MSDAIWSSLSDILSVTRSPLGHARLIEANCARSGLSFSLDTAYTGIPPAATGPACFASSVDPHTAWNFPSMPLLASTLIIMFCMRATSFAARELLHFRRQLLHRQSRV